MTFAGWIFLSASWLVILALFIFSLARALCSKDQNNSKNTGAEA
jgi:hypothetical protein